MKKIISIIIISNLFLVSCNSVRDSAGVNRKTIDEYTVVENPPLVIPPDFNLLPPEQMESRSIEDAESDLAKEILFGLEDSSDTAFSDNSLMSVILDETKANEVNSNIRELINEQFAGEKSTISDEENFDSENDLNSAIKETKNKGNNNNNHKEKQKKKKRFFFF